MCPFPLEQQSGNLNSACLLGHTAVHSLLESIFQQQLEMRVSQTRQFKKDGLCVNIHNISMLNFSPYGIKMRKK